MKKTDAHLHLNFRKITPESLIKYLDSGNIEKCWLHTWDENAPAIPSLYMEFPPEEIFRLSERYPERVMPFYAPDPSSGNCREKLTAYVKRGLKGCGELKVGASWDANMISDYLELLSYLKLPLLFHMEAPRNHYFNESGNYAARAFALLMNGAFNGVSGYYIERFAYSTGFLKRHIQRKTIHFPGYLFDFDALEKRIMQFPAIKFIGHGPHFWNNISAEQDAKYFYMKGSFSKFGIIDTLLEKYDNFYCDVSGRGGYIALTRNALQTRNFLRKHFEKVLFGTDNFSRPLLEKIVLSAGLSKSMQERIFYQNAEEILQS